MEEDFEEKTPIIVWVIAGIMYAVVGFGLLLTYPILFLIFIMFFIFTFMSSIINFIIKIKLKMQKLTPYDFGIYKEYYRDIIQEYSPLVLSYIDNFKITEEDIWITLLKLQTKNCIEIDNMKNIQVLKNSSYQLKETEKYIIKSKNDNLKELKRVIEEEALSQGLIENIKFDEQRNKKKIKRLICMFVISLISIIAITPIYSSIQSDMIILYFLINLLVYIVDFTLLYPIIRIPYLILYKYNIKQTPFIRSKKGNEINKKLAGLRNYIKDYSMLDQKSMEALTLWEDYLIYSVMFGQNKKVSSELKQFFSIKAR